MVLHDQHVHSSYSVDSNASIKEYYLEAKKKNCKYFITTEHLDYMVLENNSDWIPDCEKLKINLKEIEENDGPITLMGLELGYQKKYLQDIKNFVNKYDFDLINLSIHGNDKLDYYFSPFYLEHGINYTLKMYYDEMLEAVSTYDDFNVLSHLDYAYKTAYLIDNNTKFMDFEDIISQILLTIIKKGKALEINTKVQTYLPLEHTKELLKLYKKLGGTKITLSSDAHEVERYLDGFNYYKEIIKQCGFSYLCYYIKQKEYHYDIVGI